ncbi:MAG: hypothetical protein ACFFB9_09060 [Promethearchaeota archaeon]
MNKKCWKYWTFLLNIFGCIQFIILSFIAMFYYKGGTYLDPSSQGYSFWYNYFSDLGRIYAHSGNLNLISFLLFAISLSILGGSQIPFYIAFQNLFSKNEVMKIISCIGSVFGIFAGIFFICTALVPSDISGFWHNLFASFGFGSISISISLYTAVIFQNDEYPNSYAITCLITSIIWIIFYWALFFIPNNNISTLLFINVSRQKIILYALLICGIYQGYGALRQLHS